MERLKRMSVFAKVVELGSFTAAARQLQMSVSSISQTVSKLEDELQVKLLNRSTRSIGLTEAGKIYYQGCRRMLLEVQDVHEQLYAFNNTPIGTLRIGCSSTMAQNVLAAMTAEMLKEYPGLNRQSGDGHPGAGSDCRRPGRGDPRRRVAGFQPVFPSAGQHADGRLRLEKLSGAVRRAGETRRSHQPFMAGVQRAPGQ
jgi:molybdenum-dependent DNA-binding transcriptional regulator ModE